MWATAQICKITNLKKSYGGNLQVLDKFNLVFFIFLGEMINRLGTAYFGTDKWMVACSNFGHFSLNPIKIF